MEAPQATPPMANPPMAGGGATPPPMPMATPPMAGGGATPPPAFEEGGAVIKKGGGIKEWFSDINIVDVTISAFIVGAVIYTVQYYKFMMMLEKTGYADLKGKVAKLQSSVDATKAEMNAAGKMQQRGRRAPLSRLG